MKGMVFHWYMYGNTLLFVSLLRPNALGVSYFRWELNNMSTDWSIFYTE